MMQGLPAVHHHRSSVWGCRGLDPAQESQQTGSVVRHTVLRPGGEVELAHLMLGRVTSLHDKSRTFTGAFIGFYG